MQRFVPQFLHKSKSLFVWLLLIQLISCVALVIWWGYLIISTRDGAHYTQSLRMVFWEGAWFIGVIVTTSVLLGFYYFRDQIRHKTLRHFLAVMGHELKTPLSSIRLVAESLGMHKTADAYSKELAERLKQDVQKLERNFTRALEMARSQQGGSLNTSLIELEPLFNQIIRQWRYITNNKDIQIITDIESGCETLMGDTHAIQVILDNLFDNSLAHCGAQLSRVELKATLDQKGRPCIEYSDNGPGIEDYQLLSQLFYKGVNSSGTGVGLYLIKQLMYKMKGDVIFAPAKSGGLKVTLCFPHTDNRHWIFSKEEQCYV